MVAVRDLQGVTAVPDKGNVFLLRARLRNRNVLPILLLPAFLSFLVPRCGTGGGKWNGGHHGLTIGILAEICA